MSMTWPEAIEAAYGGAQIVRASDNTFWLQYTNVLLRRYHNGFSAAFVPTEEELAATDWEPRTNFDAVAAGDTQ